MVMAVLDSLNPQETKDLTKALLKLQRFLMIMEKSRGANSCTSFCI